MSALGLLLLSARVLLGLCLVGYAAYAFLTLWAARQWFRARKPVNPDWTPPVTILKPVYGLDKEAYENFASYCLLDYPADRYQIIFGALDPADPALELAHRLQREFPHIDITVVSGGPPNFHGTNRKVCNLVGMSPSIKYDLLVLNDSDVRATPDFLRRIVAPFEPGTESRSAPVGMVTCPHRVDRAQSFAAVLEGLGNGADYIPSVMVSRAMEGVSFGLGPTMVLPRSVLQEIGGFEALAELLADDYWMGNKTRKAGYEVVLSDYIVDVVLGQERFASMWARRLRWARTVRVCRPAGYAGTFITHGTALALLFLVMMGFSPWGWAGALATLAIRHGTALAFASWYLRDKTVMRYGWLLSLSDLFSFALYVLSFCGDRIQWRGVRFQLLPDGRLVPLSPVPSEANPEPFPEPEAK